MTSQCNKRIKIEAMEHEVPSVHPEMAWNDEMCAFYNGAYGLDGKTHLKEKILQWTEISDQSSLKERTNCIMCGAGDHAMISCPNACCFKCGEQTASFQDECSECIEWASAVCRICGEQGHSKNDCPDHWRCYHSTIENESPMEYAMIDEPRNFTFKWNSNGNGAPGEFYQRFLAATSSQDNTRGRSSSTKLTRSRF